MPDSTDPLDWYARAKENYECARLLIKASPSQALVHAEQAAEMLMKGKLLEMGHTPSLTHNVEYLQKLLLASKVTFTPLPGIAILTGCYVGASYPVAGYSLPALPVIEACLAEVETLGQELAPTHFPRPQSKFK